MRRFDRTSSAFEAVNDFQKGLEKGFAYFYKELYPYLVYYAFRILKDKPAAEDVVEESFIKIWDRHDTFTHPKVIKAWMYTTVRNGCLNKIQNYYSKIVHSEETTLILLEQEQVESHEYTIIKAEVIGELHKYIESLPRACREIFRLMYIHGLTVRETANMLNLEISTIKNQKARGLGLIRKQRAIDILGSDNTIAISQQRDTLENLVYRMQAGYDEAWKHYKFIMQDSFKDTIFASLDSIPKYRQHLIVRKAINVLRSRFNSNFDETNNIEKGLQSFRKSVEQMIVKLMPSLTRVENVKIDVMPTKIVRLKDIKGLDFYQIAEKLKSDVNTVLAYYHQEKARLATLNIT